MKFTAKIASAEKTFLDNVRVTLSGVSCKNTPEWRRLSDIHIDVPAGQIKNFAPGREVEIEVKLVRER